MGSFAGRILARLMLGQFTCPDQLVRSVGVLREYRGTDEIVDFKRLAVDLVLAWQILQVTGNLDLYVIAAHGEGAATSSENAPPRVQPRQSFFLIFCSMAWAI